MTDLLPCFLNFFASALDRDVKLRGFEKCVCLLSKQHNYELQAGLICIKTILSPSVGQHATSAVAVEKVAKLMLKSYLQMQRIVCL